MMPMSSLRSLSLPLRSLSLLVKGAKAPVLSLLMLATGLPMVTLSTAAQAASDELIINTMHSDPTARKAFDAILTKFKDENKNLKVTANTIDHESYKIQIRTWLPNNPPDVATWFAGNRAKYFVEKKLVEPIDDVWKPFEAQFGEGTKASVSFDGHRYLMPTNYYQWGFYYRTDLFQKAGVAAAPKTWKEFFDAITKLKAAGLTPITIGTKQSWPSAAWFDFLNMRVNGYDFHMKLLSGKEKFTDPRVKKAMGLWGDLVKAKAFPENAAAMTWQEAMALMWQGKAGMYLMGNFISTEIPADLKGKVGFFSFPTVDEKVPVSQLAPTDVYFVPAKAKNKENGKKFLSFLARAEVQQTYNEISGLLPPNKLSKIDESNVFLKSGQTILAQAQGIGQFFDRDAEPEVAKVGMDAFVEFMTFPERLDKVLTSIENTRARIHGK